jgi:hypothetical protein
MGIVPLTSNNCPQLNGVLQKAAYSAHAADLLFIMLMTFLDHGCQEESQLGCFLIAQTNALCYTIITFLPFEFQCFLDAINVRPNVWQLKIPSAKYIILSIRLGHSFKCSPSFPVGAASPPGVMMYLHDHGVSYDNRLSISSYFSRIVVETSCRATLILMRCRSRVSQLIKGAFFTFVRSLLEISSITCSP